MAIIVSALPWLVGAIFIVMGAIDLVSPARLRAAYRNLEVPAGMRLGGGALELVAGAMLLLPETRLAGAAIGVAVMSTAMTWLLLYGRVRSTLLCLVLTMMLVVTVATSA